MKWKSSSGSESLNAAFKISSILRNRLPDAQIIAEPSGTFKQCSPLSGGMQLGFKPDFRQQLHQSVTRRRDGASLVPEIRKPFDVLAERLISKKSRGD